ncbi:PDZ and LIM domain protein 5-like [Gavia stellata]|uniref:PDZ and LIM domain protein 5-like n=1 Tax=Gavia stellata TaxID=37040 RepID=UPI002896D4B4|nr:PDZ and LIM domain protein 5-like [Gavia stellata]
MVLTERLPSVTRRQPPQLLEPPGTPVCDPRKLRLIEDAEDWQPRTGTSQSRSFLKLARLTGTDGMEDREDELVKKPRAEMLAEPHDERLPMPTHCSDCHLGRVLPGLPVARQAVPSQAVPTLACPRARCPGQDPLGTAGTKLRRPNRSMVSWTQWGCRWVQLGHRGAAAAPAAAGAPQHPRMRPREVAADRGC